MDRDRLVSLQRWFDHSQASHALEFCSIGSCPKLPNPRFGVATRMDVNRWRGVDLLSKDSNPVPNLTRPAPADIDAYIRAEDAAYKGRNPLVCSAGHARSNGDDEKLAIWQDVILGSVSDQVVDEFSKKAREAYEAWTGDYAPFVWQWLDLIRPMSVVNRFVFVVWRHTQRLDVTTGMLLVDVEETIQRTREQLAPDGIEICRIPVELWDDGLCLASSLAIATRLHEPVETPESAIPAELLDNDRWKVGESVFVLDGTQTAVLRSLVELRAATLDGLRRQSGCDKASEVLKQIVKNHPPLAPFVTLPGAKGRGGYRTTIVDSRTPACIRGQ